MRTPPRTPKTNGSMRTPPRTPKRKLIGLNTPNSHSLDDISL